MDIGTELEDDADVGAGLLEVEFPFLLDDNDVVPVEGCVEGLLEKELKKSSTSRFEAEDEEVGGIGTTGGLYSSSFDVVVDSFLFFDEEKENQDDFEVESLFALPAVDDIEVVLLDAGLTRGTSAIMSRGLPIGRGGGTDGGIGGGTGGARSIPPGGNGGGRLGGGGGGGGGDDGTGGAAPGGNGGGADFGGGGGASVKRVRAAVEVTSGL